MKIKWWLLKNNEMRWKVDKKDKKIKKEENAGKTWDEREAANEIEEERLVNFKGVYFTWSIQTKWEIEMRKS
jgi:hypothetical protein